MSSLMLPLTPSGPPPPLAVCRPRALVTLTCRITDRKLFHCKFQRSCRRLGGCCSCISETWDIWTHLWLPGRKFRSLSLESCREILLPSCESFQSRSREKYFRKSYFFPRSNVKILYLSVSEAGGHSPLEDALHQGLGRVFVNQLVVCRLVECVVKSVRENY